MQCTPPPQHSLALSGAHGRRLKQSCFQLSFPSLTPFFLHSFIVILPQFILLTLRKKGILFWYFTVGDGEIIHSFNAFLEP